MKIENRIDWTIIRSKKEMFCCPYFELPPNGWFGCVCVFLGQWIEPTSTLAKAERKWMIKKGATDTGGDHWWIAGRWVMVGHTCRLAPLPLRSLTAYDSCLNCWWHRHWCAFCRTCTVPARWPVSRRQGSYRQRRSTGRIGYSAAPVLAPA